jgi:hypothetical protein
MVDGLTRAPACHWVRCQLPVPVCNTVSGTKIHLIDVGHAGAIAAHHARDALVELISQRTWDGIWLPAVALVAVISGSVDDPEAVAGVP